MQKLSKTRAARLAGISLYRLNKDIACGQLALTRAGGINRRALFRRYPHARAAAALAEAELAQLREAAPLDAPVGLAETEAEAETDTVAVAGAPAGWAQRSGGVGAEASPWARQLLGRTALLLDLLKRQRQIIDRQRQALVQARLSARHQDEELRRLRNCVRALHRRPEPRWRQWGSRLQASLERSSLVGWARRVELR